MPLCIRGCLLSRLLTYNSWKRRYSSSLYNGDSTTPLCRRRRPSPRKPLGRVSDVPERILAKALTEDHPQGTGSGTPPPHEFCCRKNLHGLARTLQPIPIYQDGLPGANGGKCTVRKS